MTATGDSPGPRLRAWRGPAWIGEWRLEPTGSLRFGRSSACDVVLDDPLVSREHLVVRPAAGGWEAVDLGSSGGTRCNGEPLTRRRLRSGDQLTLGDTLIVALDLEPTAVAAPPSPPAGARGSRSTSRVSRKTLYGFALGVATCLPLALGGLWLSKHLAARGERAAKPAQQADSAGDTHAALDAEKGAKRDPPTPAPPAAFSDAAIRALLNPVAEGSARTTPLGSARTANDGSGRFEAPDLTIALPPGALAAGTEVRVARVEQATVTMRDSFPLAKFGQLTPLSAFLSVETGNRELGAPARVSFPVPAGSDLRSLTVLSYDPESGAWESVGARLEAASGRVEADLPHFSVIVIAGVVVGTLVVSFSAAKAVLLNWDWAASARCLETAAGHFTICFSKGADLDEGWAMAVPDPGGGPAPMAAVPPLVATLAEGLERAHAAYAQAGFTLPTGRTWVYLKALPQDALFVAPAILGTPFIYVNETAQPELAEASAAHEYFHYVQHLTVGSKHSLWWLESAAVGVETAVFPKSLAWIRSYYTGMNSGTTELDASLIRTLANPAVSQKELGYQTALFAVYLTRTRGGLGFHRDVLARHASNPAIFGVLGSALGGTEKLERAWLDFGRSLVGPDWGAYLSADEKRLMERHFVQQVLRISPARGWEQHVRPGKPLSALFYAVTANRAEIPADAERSGPLILDLVCSGARELHVILPPFGPQRSSDAEKLSTSPVVATLDCSSPAANVRRLAARGSTQGQLDAIGWLVDGETDAPGDVDVRATWLLPPRNVRIDFESNELLWDAHPLADRNAKPAAPWDTYVVYRRDSPSDPPEKVREAESRFVVRGAESLCAEYAVTARLTQSEVRGSAESEPSGWVSRTIPDPRGFSLKSRLVPDSGRERIELEAREDAIGIRGLEIETIINGRSAIPYTFEREERDQEPGLLRQTRSVSFHWPEPDTVMHIVARAWRLPRSHRCFDSRRDLKEIVVFESAARSEAPSTALSRTVEYFSVPPLDGPREALEIGVGRAACIGTGPTNRGKRTELTFTEMPSPSRLALDGTLPVELTVQSSPGAPVLTARLESLGLLVARPGGGKFRGLSVQDGYLVSGSAPPIRQEGARPSDSTSWQLAGAILSDRQRGTAGVQLSLQCMNMKPVGMESTQARVRWLYDLDSLFPLAPSTGATKPAFAELDLSGGWRASYDHGEAGGSVLLELLEREGSTLRTFQPMSAVTGKSEDRERKLARLEGTVAADGTFRYHHQAWSDTAEGLQKRLEESGTGRLRVIDDSTFEIELGSKGVPTVITYRRLP